MQQRLVSIACCLALAATAASAQTNVYRWVDQQGKVHFSDTPPPAEARSSSQKRVGGGYTDQDYPYAVQMAMKRNPVTLYTAPSCGEACTSGRELLSKRGIPFSERDAQTNANAQQALKKLIGGLEVPVLVVGESQIKGYEQLQWSAALDSAGYPRERLPGQSPTRGTAEPPAPIGSTAPPPAAAK
jgi:glutaredoxin